MLTTLVVLAVFSILIIIHELGHMFMAKRVGVRVERFSLGFGKRLFGIKRGDTEYVISLFPLGGYVKFAGDDLMLAKGTPEEFFSKSPLKRFFIIVSGPLANYIFAFILFISIFMVGFPKLTTKIGNVLADYPARTSGVKEGDRIIEIDKTRINFWDELVPIVERHTDTAPLELKVARDDEIITLNIIPKVIKGKNIFGREMALGKIGIVPENEVVFVKHNLFEAIYLGGKRLLGLTVLIYRGLWLLVTGGIPFKESVSGPVGIAVIIGQALKAGFVSLLYTMAYINVVLAILNMLPIPVLDGGHVMLLALEKLRGKRVSARTQEIISQVAMYILIALMLFACWNDVNRFIPLFKR